MTPRYKPPTIKEKGGLEPHLDGTKDIHNGHGYEDWRRYRTGANEFGKPYRKQDIVDAFGITWKTFYVWDEVDKEEQK